MRGQMLSQAPRVSVRASGLPNGSCFKWIVKFVSGTGSVQQRACDCQTSCSVRCRHGRVDSTSVRVPDACPSLDLKIAIVERRSLGAFFGFPRASLIKRPPHRYESDPGAGAVLPRRLREAHRERQPATRRARGRYCPSRSPKRKPPRRVSA